MTPESSSMTRRDLLGSMALLAAPGMVARAISAPLQGPGREGTIVDRATEVLVDIHASPGRRIPPNLLRKAQGVVIVPDLVKAGFVIAGRVGRGVLVARDEAGAWTNPVFIGMAGGSFGAQIGASSTEIVLVFNTKRSVDDFLTNNKVTLGVNAAVAAGPVGRQAEAATDLQMRAEILSYSRTRGLFAGAAIAGTSIHIRHRSNDAYYRIPGILVGDIFAGRDPDDKPLNVPASATRLRAALDTICAVPKEDSSPLDDDTRDPMIRGASNRRRR